MDEYLWNSGSGERKDNWHATREDGTVAQELLTFAGDWIWSVDDEIPAEVVHELLRLAEENEILKKLIDTPCSACNGDGTIEGKCDDDSYYCDCLAGQKLLAESLLVEVRAQKSIAHNKIQELKLRHDDEVAEAARTIAGLEKRIRELETAIKHPDWEVK